MNRGARIYTLTLLTQPWLPPPTYGAWGVEGTHVGEKTHGGSGLLKRQDGCLFGVFQAAEDDAASAVVPRGKAVVPGGGDTEEDEGAHPLVPQKVPLVPPWVYTGKPGG